MCRIHQIVRCFATDTSILLKKCNIIRIPNNVLFIPTPCNPELLSIDFFNNSRLNQILELAHSKSGKYTRITWTWSLTMKTASLYIVPKVIVFPRSRNVARKTIYYAEYFVQHLVFPYISCYILEIWITFWTV